MEDVGVADDVVGAGRAHQRQLDVLSDQRREERPPGLARDRRILVGKVDHLDAVLAMQSSKLGSESFRIAMPPACPKSALATIIAEVRAAARELDDDRALPAPVAVASMVDQLPTDAIS